jgi:hypothetical protein
MRPRRLPHFVAITVKRTGTFESTDAAGEAPEITVALRATRVQRPPPTALPGSGSDDP